MSRGRARNVETIKWIPRFWLERTYIFVSEKDYMDYRQHCPHPNIIPVPETVTNYSQKFQYLLDGGAKNDKIVICDDDLYFNQYQNTNPYETGKESIRKLVVIKDREQTAPMWAMMSEMLDSIPLVGVHPRMMAQNAKTPFEWNSKIVTIQGVNLAIIKEKLGGIPRVDRFPILSDVLLNCTLLSHGLPNARITTHFVDWLPSQAPGGCSLYRTSAMQEEACRYIAQEFGPYARLVEKSPKTAKWLGETRYDLNVRWKELYNARPKAGSSLLDTRKVSSLPEEGSGPTEAVE
jgi:hypothetical protein